MINSRRLILFVAVLLPYIISSYAIADVSFVSPSEGSIGTQVTLHGAGFGAKSGSVKLVGSKGTKATLKVASWSDTQIQTKVSKGSEGTFKFVVKTKAGKKVPASQLFFLRPPKVTSVVPKKASAGESITVAGDFFGETKANVKGVLKIGGNTAQVSSWSMQKIEAVVPNGSELLGVESLQVLNKIGKFTPCLNNPSNKISVIYPCDGQSILSYEVDLEIEKKGLKNILVTSALNAVGVTVVGSSALAKGVLLLPGENVIEISAKKGGKKVNSHLTLFAPEVAEPQTVELSISPSIGEAAPLNVEVTVTTSGISESTAYLVDKNGDGIIDLQLPPVSPFSLSFTAAGTFPVVVTVQTSDGHNVTSPAALVSILPPIGTGDGTIALGSQILDMEYEAQTRRLFVLTTVKTVKIVDLSTGAIKLVALPGTISPRGIGLDAQSNILVADSGKESIFRFLAATNYQPDSSISPSGSFGSPGSYFSQFSTVSDVAVIDDIAGQRIFAADTENSRIQVFEAHGGFLAQFNGTESPKGPMLSPNRLLSFFGNSIGVVDPGTKRIMVFSSQGELVEEISGQGTQSFQSPAHLALTPGNGYFVVTDKSTSKIYLYSSQGKLKRSMSLVGSNPIAAVIDTTETGQRLIVAKSQQTMLTIYNLLDEVPQSDPLAIMISFISSVKSGNLAVARSLVDSSMVAEFDEVAGDPFKLEKYKIGIGSVSNLTLVSKGEELSYVSGNFLDGLIDKSVTFALRRSKIDGKWNVLEF